MQQIVDSFTNLWYPSLNAGDTTSIYGAEALIIESEDQYPDQDNLGQASTLCASSRPSLLPEGFRVLSRYNSTGRQSGNSLSGDARRQHNRSLGRMAIPQQKKSAAARHGFKTG